MNNRTKLAGLALALTCVLVPAASLAGAPAGRFSTTAETVLDTVTGLTWQRVVPTGTYTWAAGKTYCEELSLAGHDDWRMPSRKELRTIVDIRAASPAIDTKAFPNTPSEPFWVQIARPGQGWFVHFNHGGPHRFGDPAIARYIRCVR